MTRQSYLNHLQWGLVLSEAWSNNEFRQRLERDPTSTVKAYARDRMGVELEHVFQMPPRPAELGVEALRSSGRSGNQVAGAASACACATSGSGGGSGQVTAPASACACATSGSGGGSQP